jgi:hypothetical protein
MLVGSYLSNLERFKVSILGTKSLSPSNNYWLCNKDRYIGESGCMMRNMAKENIENQMVQWKMVYRCVIYKLIEIVKKVKRFKKMIKFMIIPLYFLQSKEELLQKSILFSRISVISFLSNRTNSKNINEIIRCCRKNIYLSPPISELGIDKPSAYLGNYT